MRHRCKWNTREDSFIVADVHVILAMDVNVNVNENVIENVNGNVHVNVLVNVNVNVNGSNMM